MKNLRLPHLLLVLLLASPFGTPAWALCASCPGIQAAAAPACHAAAAERQTASLESACCCDTGCADLAPSAAPASVGEASAPPAWAADLETPRQTGVALPAPISRPSRAAVPPSCPAPPLFRLYRSLLI